MGFAIFSDINGNLEALEAIIKHAKRNKKIKELYFLGDAIVYGPDSSACLKMLKKNNVICITGNHEQRIVRYDKAVKTMTYATCQHMQYVFGELDREDLAFIKTMDISKKINYRGVNIFFTHYAHDKNGVVRDDYDEFTESRLDKLFGEYGCDVVFFGHIHKRKIIINESGKSYVCLGSSGCVKGEKTFYTYFDICDDYGEDMNFDIYRVNVPFNRKKFDEKMRTKFLPDKEDYAGHVFGLDLKNKQTND